jgi:hypothetical protein
MKLKTKLIIAAIIIGTALLVASHIALYVCGYRVGKNECKPEAIPAEQVVIKPAKKDVACSIHIGTVKAYEKYMSFVATAAGESICDITIPRPAKWQPVIRKHLLLLGLTGGYYAGAWLPGGSIDYMYRLGGFRSLEFFMGPGLTISALNEQPSYRYVAVQVRLNLAVLF